jgi:hypothetical protein
MASVSPRVIASPDCADAPDKAATCPILIGSAAKAPDPNKATRRPRGQYMRRPFIAACGAVS